MKIVVDQIDRQDCPCTLEIEGIQSAPHGYTVLILKSKKFHMEVNAREVLDAVTILLALSKRDDEEFDREFHKG